MHSLALALIGGFCWIFASEIGTWATHRGLHFVTIGLRTGSVMFVAYFGPSAAHSLGRIFVPPEAVVFSTQVYRVQGYGYTHSLSLSMAVGLAVLLLFLSQPIGRAFATLELREKLRREMES
jgi:hypothetical protein